MGLALLWTVFRLLPATVTAALRTDMRARPLDTLAAAWIAGLLGNHLLLLLARDIAIVRTVTLLVAGAAAATALWRHWRRGIMRRHLRLGLRLMDVAVASSLVTLPDLPGVFRTS